MAIHSNAVEPGIHSNIAGAGGGEVPNYPINQMTLYEKIGSWEVYVYPVEIMDFMSLSTTSYTYICDLPVNVAELPWSFDGYDLRGATIANGCTYYSLDALLNRQRLELAAIGDNWGLYGGAIIYLFFKTVGGF